MAANDLDTIALHPFSVADMLLNVQFCVALYCVISSYGSSTKDIALAKGSEVLYVFFRIFSYLFFWLQKILKMQSSPFSNRVESEIN